MPSDKRRVVIVGGTGYVGGRVALLLAERCWEVRVIGRRWHGEATSLPTKALDVIEDSDARLDEALQGADVLVNCVAQNEQQAAVDPERARHIAVTAASRLVDAASRLRIPRLLHLSTVHVYGKLTGELDECSPLRPVHPYAVAHAAAEAALAAATGPHTQSVVLRVSNAVGPPARAAVDRWTLVTNDLARSWATRGFLELHSAGDARRDFVTLEDVGRAAHHLATTEREIPAVLNVCSGHTRTIFSLAERIAALAEVVCGVRPAIRRPAASSPAPEQIAYRIANEQLRRTGFEFLDNLDQELKALLRFTMDAFGRAG